ncbi:conjugative transfer system coupling protein TraD [Acidovorax sp.]|uniref:conjugative transfer system coupling protein TraD n=1 Tax=Acidovorax sp. TaxID=1872122 RepID=UPI0025C03630|nr:conjugative transfer system coupling protein TraD [Acidovorax sp.]
MTPAKDRITALLRPIFEIRSTVAWTIAALWTILIGLVFNVGLVPIIGLIIVTAGMAVVRGRSALDLAKRQLSLVGRPVDLVPLTQLLEAVPKMGNNLWLGWGWRWEPSHTAMSYEVGKRDMSDIYPPAWLLKLMQIKRNPANERGLQWIHGLEPNEADVLAPFEALKGHCAIIATTGAIKTRLAALIIPQLVSRGDVVVVIDPKGDKELQDICRIACERTGDKNKFLKLHPAFAKTSIRMDMLKNWDRSSQVASRVSLVLSSQEESTFSQFCWMAVHRITNGVKYLGRRITVASLKSAMESRIAVERLTYEVLKKFFGELDNDHLMNRIEQEINKANSSKAPKKGGIEITIPELGAMITVFQLDLPETDAEADRMGLPRKSEDIMGLISILEANKDWFSKMIVSITPLLTKLCTDDLRDLLSPNYDDPTDPRPIMDMKRVVEGQHCLYMGTDALADPSVGKAMTAMALADLSSVAAEIYNHGTSQDDGSAPRRIHLIVDEWGDAMCEPLVQQANKGRGAGVFIWALGQTFADLVVAFGGDVSSAKRFMGNMNNLIVGAIQDPDTIKMVCEKFGTTAITVMGESKGVGSKTEDTGMEFSANQGRSASDKETELIRPELFPQLPDLQYMAVINRSMKIKGRIPVVTSN